jgi:V/A-type H+-transporting ATPase subunit I
LAEHDCKRWEKYIDPSRPKKRLFSPPDVVDVDEFMDAGRYDSNIHKLNKIVSLERQLSDKKEEYNSLKSTLNMIFDWENYEISLSFKSTKYAEIKLGTLSPKLNIDKFNDELSECTKALCELISKDERASYVSIIYHKEDADAVNRILISKGFVQSDFGDMENLPKEEIKLLSERIFSVEKNIEKIHADIASMIGCEGQLQIVYDILTTENVKLNAEKKVLKTGSVCLVGAWVPKNAEKTVTDALDTFSCAYETEDPKEGDDVPVLLENNKFASAFEPIISLYSLPKYKTFDPTFIMSIFYIIIFGLMFADVGYGFVLSLGCLLAIKLLYPRGTMKKFFTMFAICGISCMVCGALMGGYFGDLPQSVLGFSGKTALWFNPLTDPITFLVLSLVVGGVHLVTGMIIKMVILIKQGDVFAAIFDIGSWLVLFCGLGMLFINSTVGACLSVLGVAMLILTQGRHEKNILLKFGKGLLSLYNITSYASDLLSYSRILALGLASAVIAQVVNVMSTMFGKGIVGYLLTIIILIAGHLLNMAINILGTFVHTSRLQYIEFFQKFYDEGGTPFELLEPEYKYVILKSKNRNKEKQKC